MKKVSAISFSTILNRDDICDIIEDIVDSLEDGHVKIQKNDEYVDLTVPDNIALDVTVESDEITDSVVFNVSWKTESAQSDKKGSDEKIKSFNADFANATEPNLDEAIEQVKASAKVTAEALQNVFKAVSVKAKRKFGKTSDSLEERAEKVKDKATDLAAKASKKAKKTVKKVKEHTISSDSDKTVDVEFTTLNTTAAPDKAKKTDRPGSSSPHRNKAAEQDDKQKSAATRKRSKAGPDATDAATPKTAKQQSKTVNRTSAKKAASSSTSKTASVSDAPQSAATSQAESQSSAGTSKTKPVSSASKKSTTQNTGGQKTATGAKTTKKATSKKQTDKTQRQKNSRSTTAKPPVNTEAAVASTQEKTASDPSPAEE